MLFYGTVELKMTEEKFWDTTPRKYRALVDASLEFRKMMQGSGEDNGAPEFGYIDQIPGW